MPIAEQTLSTLEFPKIREQLARHSAFSVAPQLALELVPSTRAYCGSTASCSRCWWSRPG